VLVDQHTVSACHHSSATSADGRTCSDNRLLDALGEYRLGALLLELSAQGSPFEVDLRVGVFGVV
jgi:hypothetical protein